MKLLATFSLFTASLVSPLVAGVIYEPYAVTTLAGYAGFGSQDGTATEARFSLPRSTAVDRAGNVYVTDSASNTIRKVTPTGVTTTLAGLNGVAGSADGAGSEARFNYPNDIGIDASGYLYVADANNSTIRKISPEGVVTTLAGLAGSPGYQDGSGSEARFSYPLGLAVNPQGEIYVADYNNKKIRKITPAGDTSTIVPTYNFGINNYEGLGIDPQQNVYLAGGDKVYKIAGDQVVTTYCSLGDYNFSADITFDAAGNGFVTSERTGLVYQVDLNGKLTTLAGGGGGGFLDGKGPAAGFFQPSGISIDGAGNLFVADIYNGTIRKVTRRGLVTTLAGLPNRASVDGVGEAARLNRPLGIALDSSGTLFLTDAGNETIRQLSPAGYLKTLAGGVTLAGLVDGVGFRARFYNPGGTAVDTLGNVFIADTFNNVIRKMTPSRAVSTLPGAFYNPHGVAVGVNGVVYVANTIDHTINTISPAGVVATLAGAAGKPGELDGTGDRALFNLPYGLALDSAGNIYVADNGGNRIRKVSPAGVVTTLAGSRKGHDDGVGSAASFSGPTGVAVDSAGNVYVCDSNNQTLRKITPGGSVTTLAGSVGATGWVDATGSAARFYYPDGVTADANGNLYVADANNNTIRKCTPAP